MKKHKYLFVACLSLFPVMAVAGNDTLHEIMEVPSATNINKNRLYKGKVVDDRTSEPLVGATVKVKGSTIGTITDIDGNFALDIPDNISPIVFEVSYMGYASKEAAPAKTTLASAKRSWPPSRCWASTIRKCTATSSGRSTCWPSWALAWACCWASPCISSSSARWKWTS